MYNSKQVITAVASLKIKLAWLDTTMYYILWWLNSNHFIIYYLIDKILLLNIYWIAMIFEYVNNWVMIIDFFYLIFLYFLIYEWMLLNLVVTSVHKLVLILYFLDDTWIVISFE